MNRKKKEEKINLFQPFPGNFISSFETRSYRKGLDSNIIFVVCCRGWCLACVHTGTEREREKPENHQLPVIHYKNEPRLLAKSSLSTPEALSFRSLKRGLGKNLLSFRFGITTAELHLVLPSGENW